MRGEPFFWQGAKFTGWEAPTCADEGCEKSGEREFMLGENRTGFWYCEEHHPNPPTAWDLLLEEAE